jgi:hypothetical protein
MSLPTLLSDHVKHLETQGLPLQESMDIMKNAREELSVVKGEAGESVHEVADSAKKRPWIFDIY